MSELRDTSLTSVVFLGLPLRWGDFFFHCTNSQNCANILLELDRNSEFSVVMRIARIMSLGKIIVGGDDLRVQT